MTTDTRIQSLETQVRTLKRMLFGVLGVVVVGGLLAATSLQGVNPIVRARQIEIVNGQGMRVAVLGSDEYGDGYLGIAAADGVAGIVLAIDQNGEGYLETPSRHKIQPPKSQGDVTKNEDCPSIIDKRLDGFIEMTWTEKLVFMQQLVLKASTECGEQYLAEIPVTEGENLVECWNWTLLVASNALDDAYNQLKESLKKRLRPAEWDAALLLMSEWEERWPLSESQSTNPTRMVQFLEKHVLDSLFYDREYRRNRGWPSGIDDDTFNNYYRKNIEGVPKWMDGAQLGDL